ncbi:MAG: WbqC family protein [Saprospiraceae bacterium]
MPSPTLLLELFYWPPVSWIALAASNDTLWLEACEHYQKGSYRNRCHIAGPNSLQRLSVPLLKGKHQQTLVRDVRIATDQPWQRAHWRSICTAYGNAPYFEHFAGEVAPFFEKPYTYLFDLNLDVVHFLLKKTGWTGEVHLTKSYAELGVGNQPTDASMHIADLRGRISPNVSTPGELFAPLPYPQVFQERHGFLPDLSVLDLLFCAGKQGFRTASGPPSGK